MKLASETETSVIPSSSRRKRKQGNDLQLVKRPAPHVSGTCASQQPALHRVPAGRFAGRGRGRSGLLCRASGRGSGAPDRFCLLFLPASQWPPPSLRSSGRSPTSPAPTSCGSRCSPSPTTARTTRRKAAAGPSRLRRAATLSSRYGLAFRSSAALVGQRAAPSAGLLFGADETAVRVSASCSSKGWEVWDGVSTANKAAQNQEKGLPDLHKDRSETHAVFLLLFLIEKLLWFSRGVWIEGFWSHHFVFTY